MELSVRSYVPEDADALGQVFYRSVREGAVQRYDPAQVEAWSPKVPKGAQWRERLEATDTVVAVSDVGPLGFMNLDERGYLDMAFVLPEAMGKGVAGAIYAVLEGRARVQGIPVLTTQASLLAEPFFERHGWQVTRRQEVEMDGVMLNNAWMEKRLGGAA